MIRPTPAALCDVRSCTTPILAAVAPLHSANGPSGDRPAATRDLQPRRGEIPPAALLARSRVSTWVTLAALVGLACLLAPSAASAGTPTPSKPDGIRVVDTSSSSFTITGHSSTYARGYRLYASTTKSDIFVDNIESAPRTAVSSTPRLTFSGLRYAAVPYYYRVAAINGSKARYSEILTVDLTPAKPTGLRAVSGAAGTYLTWNSGPATGFKIIQGTDPTVTENRRRYRIRGEGHQFTPYKHLDKGTTYYFRVRARNGSSHSRYSSVVHTTPATSLQVVRLMTYNLLESTSDGTRVGSEVVAPWSKRRLAAAQLITEAHPDVIDIQEGAAWTGAVKGPRQVDSLVSTLGGAYGLAHTEIAPNQPNYRRTGNYVLYKRSTYKLVGAGGHWTLPYGSTAAYQILQNISTGARFLSVSPHLIVGGLAANDAKRQTQTNSLLADARALARAHHVPIIYAGDFNSDINSNHAFDGPGIAMRATNAADALDVAQHRHNHQYNSANQYMRTPPAFGQSIDHIYAPAGVAVRSWRIKLHLVGGSFVGPIPSDHNPIVSNLLFPY